MASDLKVYLIFILFDCIKERCFPAEAVDSEEEAFQQKLFDL